MRVRDASGQGTIELVGMLVVVAAIVTGIASTGFASSLASDMGDAVCRIVGGDCGDGSDPSGPETPPPSGEPPAPVDFNMPFPVLPFPGSVSISCSYTSSSTATCQPGDQPGVFVGAEGKLEIERSETTLDGEGCPTQTLSVKSTLELQTGVQGKNPTASGGLTAFLGESSSYSVTVPPDEADAMERGDRPAPNPVDPRTIRAGESVELTEEFYTGHKLQASYRALQLELGYQEGQRVSAGVARVSPSTVRIHVGDEDFVRNALKLGIGTDAAGVAFAAGAELSEGKLHTIDVDISTSAGWRAYQSFLESGELPRDGAPGTANPARSDVFEITDKTQLEARLGNLSVGGVLAESGATGVETRHPDGSVDTSFVGHFNDAGVAVMTHQEPGGDPVPTRYSLTFENVDDETIGAYEQITGRQLAHGDGGNVRFDFTPADFEAIQDQAFDQVAHRVRDYIGEDLSDDEIREIMAEYPHGGDPYGFDDAMDQAYEIAAAETPEQVLVELYTGSGVGRDGDAGMWSLIDFMQATTAARHDLRDQPSEHPDSLLPGTPVEPDCD